MKSQTSSKKTEPTRDFEIFRKRLMDELKSYQDRVNRARQELPVDSDPEDDAGVASRSAYREVTMGKLERDVQTIVEIERALSRLDAGQYPTCVGCQSAFPTRALEQSPGLGPAFNVRDEAFNLLAPGSSLVRTSLSKFGHVDGKRCQILEWHSPE
jgi:RNA polymerase-binding transcription factor DksA